MPIIAIIVALVIAVTAGGAAAESSLPGSALYPMKVTVNEGLRAGLTFTAHGRAEWGVRRAERRLEEIEELVHEGHLTPEIAASVGVRFRSHVDGVKRAIAALNAAGDTAAAADLSTTLEATLQAHAALLSRIAIVNADTRIALKDLLNSVQSESRISTQLANQSAAGANASGSGSGSGMQSAAEASMTSAEHKIAEVRSFIDAKASVSTSDSVVEANARLDTAQSSLDAAKLALEAGADANAFGLVRASLHEAQEAKLLLERRGDGTKDARSSFSASSASRSSQSSVSSSSSSRESADVNLRADAEARINAAAKKIDEVRANITLRTPRLSVTAVTQATAKLNTAVTLLSQARAKFSLSLYAEAKVAADDSFRTAVDAQAGLGAESGY